MAEKRVIERIKRSLGVVVFGTTIVWASAGNAIPLSYGTATHGTQTWQQLGTHVPNTDGVFWSVDGATWGHDAVRAGDDIYFKFIMHKKQNGTHYADYLKAWVDWGQDGAFDDIEPSDPNSDDDDVVVFDKRIVGVQNEAHPGHLGSTDYTAEFITGAYQIDALLVGDLYLRARVVCSADLGMRWPDGVGNYPADPSSFYDYDAAFNPTGHYGQGEVEEYKITVQPVPEPSMALLLTAGLIGLVGARRKS